MRTDEFITRILPLKDNLLRVAFRITGNAERSEQIFQDVMLKVWNERAGQTDNVLLLYLRKVAELKKYPPRSDSC